MTCANDNESFGHTAYVLSLVLSNLRSLSPVLGGLERHPCDAEVRREKSLKGHLRAFRSRWSGHNRSGLADNRAMRVVDVAEFKSHLKEHLAAVANGEQVDLTAPMIPAIRQ